MSGGGPGTSDPGRLTRSNVTMGSILVQAFLMQGNLIAGKPDWFTSERYEIIAVVPPGATRDDIPLMLQRLLAERFALAYHRERRDTPAYALVVRKNGPKLTPSAATPAPIVGRDGFEGLPGGIPPGSMQVDSVGPIRRVAAGAMSMAQFADYLAGQMDLPVADLTQLTGNYDVVFYYSKQLPLGSPAGAGDAPDIASALRDQLGLELQKRTVPLDHLIIDHIDKTPTAN